MRILTDMSVLALTLALTLTTTFNTRWSNENAGSQAAAQVQKQSKHSYSSSVGMTSSKPWWHRLASGLPGYAEDLSNQNLPNPKFVDALAWTNESAVVVWAGVSDHRVVGYRVHYVSEPSRTGWESVEVPNKPPYRTVLRRLHSRASYNVTVTSFGIQLAGDWHDAKFVELKLTPNNVVSHLEVNEDPPKKLTLTWEYHGQRPANFWINKTCTKEYLTEMAKIKRLEFDNGDYLYKPVDLTETSHTWETEARQYSNCTFDVSVVRHNRTYLPVFVTIETMPTAPPMVENVEILRIEPRYVVVSLKPASEEFGRIEKYWLIIVPANHIDKTKLETRNLINRRTDPLEDEPWVAAELKPSDMRGMSSGNFTIGDGSRTGEFVNYALRPNVQYVAVLRAFGSPGKHDDGKNFADSQFSKQFSISTFSFNGNGVWNGAISGTTPPGGYDGINFVLRTTEANNVIEGQTLESKVWVIGPVVAGVVIIIILGAIGAFILRKNKKKRLPTTFGSISKVIGPVSEKTPMLGGDGYSGTAMPQLNGSILPYDTSAGDSGYGGENVEMRRFVGQHQPQNYPVPSVVAVGGGGGGGGGTHPPIPIIELATHIERLKANDNFLFSQEYESIETGQQFTWDHSNMEINKPKNRYANVIAYDHSRVRLAAIDNILGSDYVNANYIDGHCTKKMYIATQGPLPETFADFWRMVWEENSATIVMLTKLEERTRIKCDQYWPTRGSAIYGLINVTMRQTVELAHYTIRLFEIQRHGQAEKREIRQLQFTAWPDHGVPDHPTPFLMFLKRVKTINPADAGSIIVHCSAGVGRTGAFIVIDNQLERLRHENTVDIYGCVTSIRAQRNYMVQTEDQYVFIHDAVLDAVQSGCTEVPVDKLYTHMQKLMQVQPLENSTAMELEFRQLSNLKFPNARYSAANSVCNKQKNRLVNILPYDSTRVCLRPSADGVEGSDYINASFIDGYRQKRAYIAAQGPLPNTAEDFWRMLAEHNSSIIVMLTKLREMGREKCCQYWPSDRGERYGSLIVEPIAEYNMPQYILREFKLTDTRLENQSRTIRHFQYTEWPEQGVPESSEYFVDFIWNVLKTKDQFGQDGPITVHCSAGVGRTGVFIALSIILDRMRSERVVDIFATVKLLRTQRPNMVQSEDQYNFLYQAAWEYLGSFEHYLIQPYE